MRGLPEPRGRRILHAVNAYTEAPGALLLAEGIEDEARPRSGPRARIPFRAGLALRPPERGAERPARRRRRDPSEPHVDSSPTASPFECLAAATPLRRARQAPPDRAQQATRAGGARARCERDRRGDLPGGAPLHPANGAALPAVSSTRPPSCASSARACTRSSRRAERGDRARRPPDRRVGRHRAHAALRGGAPRA